MITVTLSKPLTGQEAQTVHDLFEALAGLFKSDAQTIKTALEKVPPVSPSWMTIPRGQSIDLDAGQVLALAREAVNQSGGSYPLMVREILSALKLLREAFNEEVRA